MKIPYAGGKQINRSKADQIMNVNAIVYRWLYECVHNDSVEPTMK